jgi:two-component sensor histidine kinase
MPVEAGIEKEILKEHGIHSVVVVPLVTEYQLIGFLGFETVQVKRKFLEDEVILLKTIAEIITNALHRANLQLALQKHVRQVEESLEEKNVLLKEIHHRVKNNLQVISSLLSLQSAQVKDPMTVQLFRDSQNRVRTMALIHEKLYQSHDLARIDFKSYIESLSSYLVRSFAVEAFGVTFCLDIEQISLGIDQAIPCGLIVNELVTNSLKYAFPDSQQGQVTIQFKIDERQQLHLNVGDTGVGFPKNIDYQNTASLGLQLVNSLVNQLEGSIELVCSGGTEFKIKFYEKV